MFFAAQNSILNKSQIYLADSIAEKKGKSIANLMENAGFAVASEIFKRLSKKKIKVLCGLGNNGGDGFVVARILKSWGYAVDVYLLGDKNNLTGVSKEKADLLLNYNLKIQKLSLEALNDTNRDNVIIVDALLGAGLSRPVEGEAREVILEINRRNLLCVGVDVPSGVFGDDGIVGDNIAPYCCFTVTFARKKTSHLLYPAKAFCGEVVVADIGIDDDAVSQTNPYIYENSPNLWQIPKPDWATHKYQRGHLLVVGGYPMTGATRLSAVSARRVGVGLVTIASPQEAFNIYASDNAGNIVMSFQNESDFEQIITNPKINTILFGQGAGLNEKTLNQAKMINETKKKIIFDADALSVFGGKIEELQKITTSVITPHEGELLRLFPEFKKIASKLERAAKASSFLNCVVVLKGADTIIASPCGRLVINSRASHYLATAGSGDVLAGIIASLIAQGLEAFDSACAGVWIHSISADNFSQNLIAEDLIEGLKTAKVAFL